MSTRTNRAAVLAASFALSGCLGAGGEGGSCSAEHETTAPTYGANGLVLEPSARMYLTFAEIEQAYADVQQCTGIVAPGPVVAFRSLEHFGIGGYLGIYMRATRSVWVNIDRIEGIEADCDLQHAVLRHEFVHHLLDEAGSPPEDNKGHGSPMFEQCGKIVIKGGHAGPA